MQLNMQRVQFRRSTLILLGLLSSVACADEKPTAPPSPQNSGTEIAPRVAAPPFNADTAYGYIAQQLAFGPRVPNTPAHTQTAAWLSKTLQAFGAQVVVQQAPVKHYSGQILNIKNIIASYNPQASKRILLSAHWDTRPLADEDPNESRREQPIPGANDGGSGVGVLLEIARQLGQKQPNVGVDIFLWDAEDWGDPNGDETTWALGAQHWAKNPHKAGYSAAYGIHLDMVGGKNAQFFQEPHSLQYAGNIVEKVWRQAQQLGYGNYFLFQQGRAVLDDHYFINTIAKIPTINIIDTRLAGDDLFFSHWHTHGDDLDKIDKTTLRAVGETVLAVLYNEQ